jgi:signal transduction histidine kinase
MRKFDAKLFNRAVLKLAALYTAVLVILSLGFSVAFYHATSHELSQPYALPDEISQSIAGGDNVNLYIRRHDDQVRSRLVLELARINIAVLVVGSVVSYLLARQTLQPINDAMTAQSRFVSNASHELKTPLTAIAMENEVLLRDKTASKKEYVQQVESNLEEVRKLQKLSNTLLSLNDTRALDTEAASMDEVSENAVRLVRGLANAKKIKLRTEASGKITANSGALEQLLVILLDNAIKYSPKNTSVTIGGSHGKLWVRDEGPGIAEEDLPHIFDRLYRGDKSHASEGYGLGLSLAQNLAQKMNLKLSATNNPSKGATFSISHHHGIHPKY